MGEATESWVFERDRADGAYRAVASCAPVHGNVCGAFLVAASVKLARQGSRSVSLPHFVPLSSVACSIGIHAGSVPSTRRDR